jgi:hypothetical protein
VCLVNLDNRKDRLLFMDYKLKELGIRYTKISAVLGTDYYDEYNNYMKQFTQREIKEKKTLIQLVYTGYC